MPGIKVPQPFVQRAVENSRVNNTRQDATSLYPSDQREAERLDLLHEMIYGAALDDEVFAGGDKSFTRAPRQVLDVGCSTGRWAQEAALRWRKAIVHCIDLTPRFIKAPPSDDLEIIFPNLALHNPMDFTNDEWPGPVAADSMDLVNMSLLLGKVSDWQEAFCKAYRCMTPGRGLVQFVDLDWELCCNTDRWPAGVSPYRDWWNALKLASRVEGKPMEYPHNVREMLHAAGFVEATEQVTRIPFFELKRDDCRTRAISGWFKTAMQEERDLMSLCLALFTEHFGMTPAQVFDVCSSMMHVMTSASLGRDLYINLRIWTARRPGSFER